MYAQVGRTLVLVLLLLLVMVVSVLHCVEHTCDDGNAYCWTGSIVCGGRGSWWVHAITLLLS